MDTNDRMQAMLATLWTSDEIRANYDDQKTTNEEEELEAGKLLDALGNPMEFPSYEEWLVSEQPPFVEQDGRWRHYDAAQFLWWAAVRIETERLLDQQGRLGAMAQALDAPTGPFGYLA